MNAELLLAHYEQIADAPDAVARLRRFILDLAVRGKLVAQDAKDEPAAELLKRIAEEKTRLVKAGEIKPQKPLLPIANNGLSFDLPELWTDACLADIAVCLDYKREPINETERDKRIEGKAADELYPYYGATQQQGWIDGYLFDEELVLLGEDGVPFFDPIRSKAYLISGKTWVNNHAHVFKGVLISHVYLVHCLNVFDYSGRVVGATRSKLNQARALDIPVALPPLAEQHRIVAKVDELMALCDGLESARGSREAVRDRLAAASLARLNAPDPETFQEDARFALDALPVLTTRPDQVKQLRQTILNLAVRGKLVPQDPNDKSASELLKRIEKEKIRLHEERGTKPDRPLPGVTSEEIPFSVPEGWVWARTQDLSLKISDGVHQKPNYVAAGIPFVTVKNLTEGAGISFRETKFITERDHAEFIKRTHPEKGDVLITKDGTIGVARIIDTDRVFSIFVSVALVKMVLPAIAPFLTLCINADVVRDTIVPKGAALKHLHLVDLRNLPLPLPPLAEQHRIVAKLDELMALCDRLEANLATADETRRRLLEAILAEALAPDEARELEAAE
jgi:type I restriction enzyme S subunit